MTYRQAVAFLEKQERFGVRLGLTNMARLLRRLGNPEKELSAFHIAGTNGKGSTARLLSVILTEAGYRTGLYTSPHLFDTRERIQVNNKPIPKQDFAELMATLKPEVEHLSEFLPHSPTYFETITAAAFLYFQQKKVDYAVIEVGMGGRLDATNLIKPLVAIITPVGLEHRRFLGSTLSAIAGEKAGIIKAGRPVVCGRQRPAALRVISQTAKQLGAPFYHLERLVTTPIITTAGPDGTDFSLHFQSSDLVPFTNGQGQRNVEGLHLALPGHFQVENAGVATLSLAAAGLRISESAFRSALAKITWPGRLEVISRKPLVIFDASHNPPALKTLLENLDHLYPTHQKHFLFGVLKDKDYRTMLRYLGSRGVRFTFTRPVSGRAREPEDLARVFKHFYPTVDFQVVADPKEALRIAKKGMGENDLLCVCGSFYLASTLLP